MFCMGYFHHGIVEEIRGIPLVCVSGQNRMVWSYTKNGKFTIKSCYYELHVQRNEFGTQAPSSSMMIQD